MSHLFCGERLRNSNSGNIVVGVGAAATILSIDHDLASAALALVGTRSKRQES